MTGRAVRWGVALLVAGVILAAALLSGCEATFRPATGTGRATAYVCSLSRVVFPHVEHRRLVIANNPTNEDVILECNGVRYRIPAGLAADVLLMPSDKGCDMHNDVDYESVPIPDVTDIAGAIKKAPAK